MGKQQKEWTKEEIIYRIKEFYKEKGRTPLTKELNDENNLPSYGCILKTLNCKNYDEVFDICGIKKQNHRFIIKLTMKQE